MSDTQTQYFVDRLAEYGIAPSASVNKFTWSDEVMEYQSKTWPYFEPDDRGIRINTPTAWGSVHYNPNAKKFKPVWRIRLEQPYRDEDSGALSKYIYSQTGYGSYLFIPPNVYDSIQAKERIETLYVTEGEFKAFVPAMYGLPIVGIPGIHNFRKGKGDKMLLGLKYILDVCDVDNVVIVYDSDMLDLSSKVGKDSGKTFDARPRSFMSSARFLARAIRGNLKDGLPQHEVYLAHIKPREGGKSGLDDLLKTTSAFPDAYKEDCGWKDKESRKAFKGRCQDVVMRLMLTFQRAHAKITTHKDNLFACYNITYEKRRTEDGKAKVNVLGDIFHLTSARHFWDYHKTRQLKGYQGIRFRNHPYKIENGIPVHDDMGNVMHNPLYRKGNAYWKELADGRTQQLSSFSIQLHYVIYVNAERTIRIATFNNVHGMTKFTELEKQAMTSTAKFEEKLESWKGFKWFGNKRDLTYLSMLLDEQDGVKEAIMVEHLGHNAQVGGFVVADGIHYDGEFYPIDEYGIVSLGNKHYYLPFFSRLAVSSTELSEYKWLRHLSRERRSSEDVFDFKKWMILMEKVHNAGKEWNGTIAALYAVYTSFSSLLYDYHNASPILAISGIPRSGKSELARSVMNFFGEHKVVTNIHNISTTAVNRLAAQYCDVPLWLDEWKNDLPKWKQELVKASWDRSGKALGTFTNDNNIRRVKFTAPFIITGQDVPGQGSSDPAIFSRCIHLHTRRTQHDDKILESLKSQWQKGLTHLMLRLQDAREVVAERHGEKVAYIMDKVKHEVRNYDSRMLLNYCLLLAPALILEESGYINLSKSEDKLIEMVVRKLRIQMRELNSSNELGTFWHILDQLKHHPDERYALKDRIHYRIDDDIVSIHIGGIYDDYISYAKDKNLRKLDKNTLESYLQGQKGFESKGKQVYLTKRGKQKCFQFNRKVLIESTGKNTFKTPDEIEREQRAPVDPQQAPAPSAGGQLKVVNDGSEPEF